MARVNIFNLPNDAVFLGNFIEEAMTDNWLETKTVTIPTATKKYSSIELQERGLVGVFYCESLGDEKLSDPYWGLETDVSRYLSEFDETINEPYWADMWLHSSTAWYGNTSMATVDLYISAWERGEKRPSTETRERKIAKRILMDLHNFYTSTRIDEVQDLFHHVNDHTVPRELFTIFSGAVASRDYLHAASYARRMFRIFAAEEPTLLWLRTFIDACNRKPNRTMPGSGTVYISDGTRWYETASIEEASPVWHKIHYPPSSGMFSNPHRWSHNQPHTATWTIDESSTFTEQQFRYMEKVIERYRKRWHYNMWTISTGVIP